MVLADGDWTDEQLDQLVQVNVRIPRRLILEADRRRKNLPSGPVSRDKWVARALRWALSQPVESQQRSRRTLARTPSGRTGAGVRR